MAEYEGTSFEESKEPPSDMNIPDITEQVLKNLFISQDENSSQRYEVAPEEKRVD